MHVFIFTYYFLRFTSHLSRLNKSNYHLPTSLQQNYQNLTMHTPYLKWRKIFIFSGIISFAGIDGYSQSLPRHGGASAANNFNFQRAIPSANVQAPAIALISPNGGEWWLSGAHETITWNAGVGIAHLKIELSTNGGRNWSTIANNIRYDGAHVWLVPDTVSHRALIRITDAAGSGASDVSDGAFVLTRDALINFTESSNNPILRPGSAGSWDEGIRERGWFMYENGEYHMWYGGWRGTYNRSRSALVNIGYASSADGVHWAKSGNPVSTGIWAEDFVVLKSDTTYYLYAEDEFTGDGDGAHIDLYTSTNKINWSHGGTVLARGSRGWENDDVGTPVVWKEGNTWYMLYEGSGSESAGRVGLATSHDGKNWTRNSNNPVLANPRSSDNDIALDSIIKINGVYHAYGHYDIGRDTWVGGLFISSDLISWTAYPGNPVTGTSPVIVDNGKDYFMYNVRHITAEQYQYQMSYSNHATAPPAAALTLISPNGEESWAAGSIETIQWHSPVSWPEVKLEYSVNNGASWTTIIAAAANEGSHNWIIPYSVSNQCLVRISNAAEADISDAVFEIVATPAPDLSDDFNSDELNTNMWLRGANSGNHAEIAQGALHLHSANNATGWICTAGRFSGRNKIVQIKIVQPNEDGALGMSPTVHAAAAAGFFNELNWYRFYNYRSGDSGPYKLFVQWKRNGAEGGLEVATGVHFTGAFYLRLRTNGTRIFFEYSFNNNNWTAAYSESFSLPGYTLDNLFAFELSANDTPSKGEWVLDDFAVYSSTPSNGDLTPPMISQVAAGNVSAKSATITWNTDEPADAQVEYGLTAAYGSLSSHDALRITNHSISFTDLIANTTYHYLVKSRDAAGNLAVSDDFIFKTGLITGVDAPSESSSGIIPVAFAVGSYPNPFNLATRIRFELPQAAEIGLTVFDLAGNTVQELTRGQFATGRHEVAWNGKNKTGVDLSTGIYLIRLQYRVANSDKAAQIMRRVMLLK